MILSMTPTVAPPGSQPAPVAVAPVQTDEKKPKNGKKVKEEPPPPPPHWSYTGKNGPEKWGNLGQEYATCDLGKRQSPIDIQ